MPPKNESNELHLTRVYDAPVKAVWDAWTIDAQVAQWWGPRGFTITTHSKDLRPGGSWRYTMHGPDGVDYPNVTHYYVVEPCARLVYDHGGSDDAPPLFRVTVDFRESGGKTTMHMKFALATPEAARQIAKFIKQASGESTWDRLAEYIAERDEGATRFVYARAFDAPIARVFAMWTEPEHLARWLPPAGSTLRFVRADIAAGKSTLFVLESPAGGMRVRAEYLAVERPHRVVYDQQFVDEHERPLSELGGQAFPSTLRTTVVLAEEAPDRTRVTIVCEPQNGPSAPELAAFVAERGGMTRGWSASFDVLESMLEHNPDA